MKKVFFFVCLFIYGSLNAQSKKKQIEMLTESKDSIQCLLDKEREAHASSKMTLTNQNSELNNQINDLNSKSETQNARIANLESQLKKLETQLQVKEQENFTQKNTIENLQSKLKDKMDSLLILHAELFEYKSKPELIKEEEVFELAGIYLSNEKFIQDDLRDDEEARLNPLPDISFQKITISKNNDTMIIQQDYQSDPGTAEGCDGSYYLKANAEIIRVQKLDSSIYIFTLKKLLCNYHNGGEFACDGQIINIEEYLPKLDSYFDLTINLKNKKSMTFHSTAEKTECKGAWDLQEYTFFKQ